jgi:hypothetical protein
MAGLIADDEGGEHASTKGGNSEFAATDASAGPPGESHLDSFIDSSGWSREDLVLVLMLLQTTLLIAWYVEVRDA